jgi:hypothetical protein
MGGVQVATAVALFTLAVTVFNIAREILWPRTAPGPAWLGAALMVAGLLVVLAAAAVMANAFGRGPKWARRMVDTWVAPHDSKPYPDMPIVKVVARRCPQMAESLEKGDSLPAGEYDQTGELLKDFRQRARIGQLAVWGRLDATAGYQEHTPLSEIPVEFWEKGTMGYLELLKDGKGKAERRKLNGDKEWYDDIWFNERQVNKLYPFRRSRMKLQTPWTRVSS